MVRKNIISLAQTSHEHDTRSKNSEVAADFRTNMLLNAVDSNAAKIFNAIPRSLCSETRIAVFSILHKIIIH